MKALVGAFNHEKALVGAFSVIVKMSYIPDEWIPGAGNVMCELEAANYSQVWASAIRHGKLWKQWQLYSNFLVSLVCVLSFEFVATICFKIHFSEKWSFNGRVCIRKMEHSLSIFGRVVQNFS